MAFALLYDDADLQEIENRFTEARASNAMTQTQRRRATDYWNAGLSGWKTAPITHDPQWNCEPEGCRVVVVSLANGSRADFLGLCTEILLRLPVASIQYFSAVVDDLKNTGSVEPWPPA